MRRLGLVLALWVALWVTLAGCLELERARAVVGEGPAISAGSSEFGPALRVASLAVEKKRARKHFIYLILDALILSSPLTGFIAVVMFLDPEVRDRPPGLLTYTEEKADGIHLWPGVRRRILTKLALGILTATACGLGLLTLLLHLLDLIPRIT